MKFVSILRLGLAATGLTLAALSAAQTDTNPYNPANWLVTKTWSGNAVRDIWDQNGVNIFHDDGPINGVVSKTGYFLTVGVGQDKKFSYQVNVHATCHVTAVWRGVGGSPSFAPLQVTVTAAAWAYAQEGGNGGVTVSAPNGFNTTVTQNNWYEGVLPDIRYFSDMNAHGVSIWNTMPGSGAQYGMNITLGATSAGRGYSDPDLDFGNFGGKLLVDAVIRTTP